MNYPDVFGALIMGMKVAVNMSETESVSQSGLMNSIMNPSMGLAKFYFGIGLWGLVLAILNLMGMVHPTQKVSWAGMLTINWTNNAFHPLTENPGFVASDAVFILICGGIFALAMKKFSASEGGVAGFFQSMIKNDLWPSLVSLGEGGMQRTAGAWCILIGLMFYISWGIQFTTWIDPGVYAVSIALLAFGFALDYASKNPAE